MKNKNKKTPVCLQNQGNGAQPLTPGANTQNPQTNVDIVDIYEKTNKQKILMK